jgi:hypothetical protein
LIEAFADILREEERKEKEKLMSCLKKWMSFWLRMILNHWKNSFMTTTLNVQSVEPATGRVYASLI